MAGTGRAVNDVVVFRCTIGTSWAVDVAVDVVFRCVSWAFLVVLVVVVVSRAVEVHQDV